MQSYGWVFLALGLTLGGGFLAYVLARRGRARAALAACVLVALLGVVLLIAAQSANGWDGLGYLLIAMLFVAPTFVGMSLGAVIGFVIARRATTPPIEDVG